MRGAWGALNAALILLAVGVVLAGCGRKGPPVVPRVPAAAKLQPSFRAEGDTLVLAWRYPAGALQPESFRILRAEPETGCPECPPRFHEVGTLGAQIEGEYLFRDEGLTPGAAYAYQVLPLFPRGVEGPLSDTVRLTWRATPPPTGLAAVPGEGGVRLFWEPEVGLKGYAVYRGEGTGEMTRLAEVEVPPYLDAAVQSGRTYRYAVAAIGQTGEGPPSAPVEATTQK